MLNKNSGSQCHKTQDASAKTISTDRKHSFSKVVAEARDQKTRMLGATASIILKYLSYKIRKQGSEIEGKKWFRVNLDHISEQYPYLGRSTVDDALNRLVACGALEIANQNTHFRRPKFDRTRSFHVPKKWMNVADKEVRYFDSGLAAVVGVPAAVIHYNFSHWIDYCVDNQETPVVELSPAKLVSLLPFSKATIKRAITQLREHGLIIPVPGKRCRYSNGTFVTGSEADENGSNSDEVGSRTDEDGSEADNDISCSPFVDLLKKSSKTTPSASSENSYSVREMNENIHDADTNNGNDAARKADDSGQKKNATSPKFFRIWKQIKSLKDLHQHNRSLTAAAEAQNFDALSKFAQTTANKFFKTISPQEADALYDNADPEEVFAAVYPQFFRIFSPAPLESELSQILNLGTLEAIIGGFLWPKEQRNSYSHPFRAFINSSYWIYLALHERAEERRQKAVAEELIQRQEEHPNRDADLENEADLSPAQKTRVFKQGLYSRNKIGGIHFDQIHRTNEILISKAALSRIEKFFSLNEEATAGEVLEVMDRCLALCRSRPKPTTFRRGIQWHSLMGYELWSFATYLPRILLQLGLSKPWTFGTITDHTPSTAETGSELVAEMEAAA